MRQPKIIFMPTFLEYFLIFQFVSNFIHGKIKSIKKRRYKKRPFFSMLAINITLSPLVVLVCCNWQ